MGLAFEAEDNPELSELKMIAKSFSGAFGFIFRRPREEQPPSISQFLGVSAQKDKDGCVLVILPISGDCGAERIEPFFQKGIPQGYEQVGPLDVKEATEVDGATVTFARARIIKR